MPQPKKGDRRVGQRRGPFSQPNPPAISSTGACPTIFFRQSEKRYTSTTRKNSERRKEERRSNQERRAHGDRRMGTRHKEEQTAYGPKRIELRPEQVQYLSDPKPTLHHANAETLQQRTEIRELSLAEAARRNALHSQFVEGEGIVHFEDRRKKQQRKRIQRAADRPESTP